MLLAHALWIVLRRPHTPLDLWVSNGLGMTVTAVSALLTWQLWRHSNRLSPHNNRHIHLLFLLAFLGQFVGNAFLIALGEEGQIYRDLSLGDAGYLTYYLLMT
ncbi:MAG: hypothetical protein Q4C67_07855, partial [Deinococcus sp.]|nr:hypothetical protein [Deinococcus sp.]